jgi:hypothetical protein
MKLKIKISVLFTFVICIKLTIAQKYEVFVQNGKKGIKQDGNIILGAKYDQIYQDKFYTSDYHLKNKKYFGLFNVKNKNLIEPISKLEFKYEGIANLESYYYESYYSFITSKNKKLFINSAGNYVLNANPETLFPKKEGEYYYLFGLDSIGSLNEPLKVLNTNFLFLDRDNLNSTFIAQDLNNKFGIINCIGETLLPFENDSIDFFDYDGDGNHHILLTKNKKKILFDFTLKKEVPFYFDEIMKVNPSEYSNLFFTKQDGKFGLFCSDGTFVFPNEYENIFVANEGNYDDQKYFVGKKENKYFAFTSHPFLRVKNETIELKEYDLIYGFYGIKRIGDFYDLYKLKDHSFFKRLTESEYNAEKNR